MRKIRFALVSAITTVTIVAALAAPPAAMAQDSASYEIGTDDLAAIASSVRALRDIVEQVSSERLDDLRRDAGL